MPKIKQPVGALNLAFTQGFAGHPCDYAWGNKFWEAFTLGKFFRGEGKPKAEIKSLFRGAYYLDNGREYRIVYRNGQEPRVECTSFNH